MTHPALPHLDLLEKMIRQFNRDGEYQPHDVFRTLRDVRSAIEQREAEVRKCSAEIETVMTDVKAVVVKIRDQAIRSENPKIIKLTAELLGY